MLPGDGFQSWTGRHVEHILRLHVDLLQLKWVAPISGGHYHGKFFDVHHFGVVLDTSFNDILRPSKNTHRLIELSLQKSTHTSDVKQCVGVEGFLANVNGDGHDEKDDGLTRPRHGVGAEVDLS